MLYRIYTEDTNRSTIEGIVKNQFDAFTIIPCVGFWQGTCEDTLIIEIAGDDICSQVEKLAQQIKQTNRQQSVLVDEIFNSSRFI